ncbi:MAG: ATP-dependent Clp protease ATP-binding subunit [Ruminococcus sp.]|nr:ATP-dependent Clp protease ATP-binding subunit [Ruminococcus sp.]MDY3896423.1 ATP-dependent Clp protease ATP-binding subunit [Candidatus Fimenecus sp.]
MFKFTGFTEKANKSLNAAVKAAENLGHTYIGSEHILLGLLSDTSTVAGAVLASHNITYADIEDELKRSIGVGVPTELQPDDFTPRSKNILETSVAFARQMGQQLVGTEHVLLAIAREGSCSATLLLSRAGVSMQDIVNDVSKALMGGTANAGTDNKDGGKENESMLSQFGRDLTKLAKDGKIDPVIGRQKEIERVIQILSRRTKNNPCLIGEPGVGKTAIAEGLALKIVSGEVPELLKDKKIYSLDLTGMVAGTKYRGDFEERIKKVIDEVKNAKDVILFIDEVHTLIGAGSAEGAADAANILKPSLARGELQIIGATTIEEYRKHIEKDAALERRFQPVMVDEPSQEEAIEILKGIKDKYEAHHKVKITDEAIESAVKLSTRYIGDRYLPDKAIDLIDEAASRVRLRSYTAPSDLKELEDKKKSVEAEKLSAVNAQEFERAAALRDEERKLDKEIKDKKENWHDMAGKSHDEVTPADIADIVSSWTGVPVTQLSTEESDRLLHMEDELHRRIVGQDEAVEAVSRAIRRGRVGLKDPKKPIGSFIFLGPTGVGKTELCKALAAAMFGDENAMIRLDMSEYMEKHTVSRLIGSPPGYVGYDEGGQLTEKVRRKPYSVVLFDEIEKAHPDVFNMLLQILDDGVLTDGQGRRVDFKNCIIIMTSNVGAKLISQKQKAFGFAAGAKELEQNEKEIKDAVMGELRNTFRPEFLNRVDDIIVFQRLTKENIKEIASRLLAVLQKRVEDMGIEVTFSDEAVSKIADAGFDDVYGARPLKRAIQSRIEDALSEEMLKGNVKKGGKYICNVKDDKFVFDKAEEKTVTE